jgi:hypothetical protein
MRTDRVTILLSRFLLTVVFLTFALLAQQGSPAPAAGTQQESSPAPTKSDLMLQTYGIPKPVAISADDLKALPHIPVTIHNPHTDADETYSGVRLSDLLAKIAAPLGSELHGKALANYIVATGSDGYKAVLALGEVDPTFHPGEVIVADAMNGKPLDARSGPFTLVVTEDKRPARSVRNLVSIELKLAQ